MPFPVPVEPASGSPGRVNVVDLLVVVLVVAFALAGLRQGFVVSVVSFAGFVAGGLLGLELMPLGCSPAWQPGRRGRWSALGGVVVLAVGVQALAGWAGCAAADRITWRPARRVDAVGRCVRRHVAVLVAVWLLGGVLLGAGASAAAVARRPATPRCWPPWTR